MIVRHRQFQLALICLLARVCYAQIQTAHVSEQPVGQHGYGRGSLPGLEQIIDALDPGKLRTVASGSWEEQVLNAAEQSAATTINANFTGPNLAGIYTLQADAGDVLVARWNKVGDTTQRATWLWDTPFYTVFVAEVDPTILQPGNLPNYCEGLLNWDRDPLHLKSLLITYLDSSVGKEQVTGLAKHITQEQGSWRLWFAATARGNKAYVGIGMSKPIFWSEYPAEAYQVRERFPPLRLRLKSVSRPSLFAELGKGYPSAEMFGYPTNRDAIVMSELLSRGPVSDVEAWQITVGGHEKGDYGDALIINARLSAFLTAVEGAGGLEAHATVLESVLLGAPLHRAAQDIVTGQVFGTMERHSVDFTHSALALLQVDRGSRSALHYLQRNTRDEETLRRLEGITVKPDLIAEKKAVVDNIKKRLNIQP